MIPIPQFQTTIAIAQAIYVVASAPTVCTNVRIVHVYFYVKEFWIYNVVSINS